MENYAANLKSLRKYRGYTQKELADKAGVSTVSIQRYESGQRKPRLGAFVRIAMALDAYFTILLDGKIII